jgi:hypothetical protein
LIDKDRGDLAEALIPLLDDYLLLAGVADRLEKDNVSLREDNTSLRQDNVSLRKDTADLRELWSEREVCLLSQRKRCLLTNIFPRNIIDDNWK